MSTVQTSIKMESSLFDSLSKIAQSTSKSISEIIGDALTEYVQRHKSNESKRRATQKFLRDRISFNELVSSVGYDDALAIKEGKKGIKESVNLADQIFGSSK
ncbi:MAG: ribbon-helix-helix protein, CopG family [Methanosarcinales archaeon]